MIESKIMERYFFFGLLLATLLFTFFIFKPFLVVLVLGICFAIVLHPVYEFFKGFRIPNFLASLLTVIFFIIVVCGPLLGIGKLVFDQSQDIYANLVRGGSAGPFVEKVDNAVNNFLPGDYAFDAGEKISSLSGAISRNIAQIFSTTLTTLFLFLLLLLAIFYFLKDGARWREAVVVLSPLADANDEQIISRLRLAVDGVVKGYLLVALVQGLLMGVGLAIFGVPHPALWGVVAAIASLVPTIGTALVSIPAFIFLFLFASVGNAIGFLIWSALLVGMIDNFLSPAFIGKKIDIPPLFILFAVLGGVSLLGPVGILIGPLAVSLLYTLISIYRHEFRKSGAY
ncbi:MAG: AI-2E family transporter [Patescibacteria group bacterium]